MSSDETRSSHLSHLGMMVKYSYELRLCVDWQDSFRALLCSPYSSDVVACYDGHDLREVLSATVATMHQVVLRGTHFAGTEELQTLGYRPCSSDDLARAKAILEELLASPAASQRQGCARTRVSGWNHEHPEGGSNGEQPTESNQHRGDGHDG